MANTNTVKVVVPLFSNVKIKKNKQGTTIAHLYVRKNTKIKIV